MNSTGWSPQSCHCAACDPRSSTTNAQSIRQSQSANANVTDVRQYLTVGSLHHDCPALDERYTVITGSTVEGYAGSEFPHVGNLRDARRSLYTDRLQLRQGLRNNNHGHFRNVYVHGNWVYKIGRKDDACHSFTNAWNVSEYINMMKLRLERFPFVGPVALYIVENEAIMSMPYYPLDSGDPRVYSAWRRFVTLKNNGEYDNYSVELWDLDWNDGNVRGTSTGRLRICDLSAW